MILDKRKMTEEDIKLQFITPAIVDKWTLSPGNHRAFFAVHR